LNEDTSTTATTDAPTIDAPTTTPKRAPSKRAPRVKGVPASVLSKAKQAHNGATLARAFGLNEKRARDVMRSKGYYPLYPDRTLPKYKTKGVPTFALVRADAIVWLSAMYSRKASK
jgi:hypothetical protein